MLTAALAVADEKVREELRGALANLGVRLVMEQSAATEWPVLIGRLRRLTPDLLVIDGSQIRDSFAGATHEVKSLTPAPAVIAVLAEPDADGVLRTIRAGAKECVMPPFGASLREALERVRRRRAAAELEQPRAGKTIGFLSVKGGCGATTIACHVAARLHQATEHQILLADFDVSVGTAGYLMKAQTPFSVVDAIARHSTSDFHGWGELVWKAESRLEVLPAPAKPPCDETLDVWRLREALRSMQSQYDWVVADLGRGFNHLSRGLVEGLDELFLVSTPDVAALYRAKHMTQSLAHGGHNLRGAALILNRASKYREFTGKEIEDLLGMPVFWQLPELPDLERAFVQGRLAAAESRSARELAALTAKIAGVRPVRNPSKNSGFGLKRLLPEWFGA